MNESEEEALNELDWQDQKRPKTELEMMEFVWGNKELPQGLQDIEVHLIDAPMKPNPRDSSKPFRPTTKDTFIEWQKENPNPGSCLIISSNPFVGRQHLAAKEFVPNAETVGQPTDPGDFVAVHMREIASWVHEVLGGKNKTA